MCTIGRICNRCPSFVAMATYAYICNTVGRCCNANAYRSTLELFRQLPVKFNKTLHRTGVCRRSINWFAFVGTVVSAHKKRCRCKQMNFLFPLIDSVQSRSHGVGRAVSCVSENLYVCVSVCTSSKNENGFSYHKFGERSFCYCGPAAWNSFQPDLHDVTVTNLFNKKPSCRQGTGRRERAS